MPTNQVPAAVFPSFSAQQPQTIPGASGDESETDCVAAAGPTSSPALSPGHTTAADHAGSTDSPARAPRHNDTGVDPASPARAPGPTDTAAEPAHSVAQLSPDTAVNMDSQLILPSMQSLPQCTRIKLPIRCVILLLCRPRGQLLVR
jgi:hypothetical protein